MAVEKKILEQMVDDGEKEVSAAEQSVEEEDTAFSSPRSKQRMMVKWPSTKEKMEEIRRRSSLNESQIKSLWLNYQEFQSLRDEVHKSAYENKNKGYSKLLHQLLNNKDDEKMAQMKLDLWAKAENDLNMRGLERYVNTEHRQWRDSASREARQAVLQAQRAAQETDELEDFAEYLAAISCEHSADSKLFAAMIAKADEKAAMKCCSPTKPSPSSSSSLRS